MSWLSNPSRSLCQFLLPCESCRTWQLIFCIVFCTGVFDLSLSVYNFIDVLTCSFLSIGTFYIALSSSGGTLTLGRSFTGVFGDFEALLDGHFVFGLFLGSEASCISSNEVSIFGASFRIGTFGALVVL